MIDATHLKACRTAAIVLKNEMFPDICHWWQHMQLVDGSTECARHDAGVGCWTINNNKEQRAN